MRQKKLKTRKGNELSTEHLKARILNSVNIDTSSGCWLWTRTCNNKGYGTMTVNKKTVLSHRISFEVFNRRLLDRTLVLHRCDNPPCCNPNHLFSGTHQDNVLDAIKKGRLFRLPPISFTGSSNPMSKLIEKDVKEIRTRLSSGEFQESIAKDYGVSKSLISAIATGRLWSI